METKKSYPGLDLGPMTMEVLEDLLSLEVCRPLSQLMDQMAPEEVPEVAYSSREEATLSRSRDLLLYTLNIAMRTRPMTSERDPGSEVELPGDVLYSTDHTPMDLYRECVTLWYASGMRAAELLGRQGRPQSREAASENVAQMERRCRLLVALLTVTHALWEHNDLARHITLREQSFTDEPHATLKEWLAGARVDALSTSVHSMSERLSVLRTVLQGLSSDEEVAVEGEGSWAERREDIPAIVRKYVPSCDHDLLLANPSYAVDRIQEALRQEGHELDVYMMVTPSEDFVQMLPHHVPEAASDVLRVQGKSAAHVRSLPVYRLVEDTLRWSAFVDDRLSDEDARSLAEGPSDSMRMRVCVIIDHADMVPLCFDLGYSLISDQGIVERCKDALHGSWRRLMSQIYLDKKDSAAPAVAPGRRRRKNESG